jgi:glycolate oxidase iron-sulfur subunit
VSGGPPASFNALRPLTDACVHCGFCLPACPSYLLLGQEMDSPRGRIYMARAAADGRTTIGASFAAHFDSCLGCMACETACPSGVRYAPILEEARAAVERGYRRPLAERWFRELLFRLLPYPRRLRWLAPPLAAFRRLAPILPGRLGAALSLAPAAGLSPLLHDVPEETPAAGTRRLRVGLITGCVQRAFFHHVNDATVRTLSAEGCEVHAPRRQGCCGALALHAGRDQDARTFARRLIGTFESAAVDRIVVTAAGCGSAMKAYPRLLRDDQTWAGRAEAFASKVQDVTETLGGLTPRTARRRLNLRVAYHDACHLAHAQGVKREPRDLLASIPGLTLVPVADNDVCCGSAGIFNLVQPGMASELGRRKADRIAQARPDVVVSGNPGCLLQIAAFARARGHSYAVRHIVEVLDAAISGAEASAG